MIHAKMAKSQLTVAARGASKQVVRVEKGRKPTQQKGERAKEEEKNANVSCGRRES